MHARDVQVNGLEGSFRLLLKDGELSHIVLWDIGANAYFQVFSISLAYFVSKSYRLPVSNRKVTLSVNNLAGALFPLLVSVSFS